MYRAFRCVPLLFCLFLILLAVSASFSQQINLVDKLPDDPRLERTITLRVWKAALPDVLAKVTSQTGVRVGCDSGTRFWSIRQRKVSIIVKDMKLRDFLTQLEKLLTYDVRYSGPEGDYVYTVWQDLNSRKLEQDMLESQKKAKAEYRKNALKENISDAQRASRLTTEIKQVKKSDPWIAYLASDAQAVQLSNSLASISKDQQDELLKRLYLLCPLDSMSIRSMAAASEITSIVSTDDPETTNNIHHDDYTLDTIKISETPQDGDMLDHLFGFHARVQAKLSDKFKQANAAASVSVDFFDISPRDDESILRSAANVRLQSEGMTVDECNKRIKEVVSEWLKEGKSVSEALQSITSKVSLEKTSFSKLDRGLEKVVKLSPEKLNQYVIKHKPEYIGRPGSPGYKLKSDILQPLLETLADDTGLNVMYESFSLSEMKYPEFDQEQQLSVLLDGIAGRNQLDWVKEGNTIRFRSKDWAERCSWEFPDELRKKWFASIRAKQELSWDEMVDIAMNLDDDQIDHSLLARPNADLSCYDDPDQAVVFQLASGFLLSDMRDVLRFCGSLSPLQKEKMWSDQGLDINDISDGQLPQVYGIEWCTGNRLNDCETVLIARHREESTADSSTKKLTFVGARMKIWVKDLPGEVIEPIKEQAKTELGEKTDLKSKQIEFTFGTSFEGCESKAEVKKMLDIIDQKKAGKTQSQQ